MFRKLSRSRTDHALDPLVNESGDSYSNKANSFAQASTDPRRVSEPLLSNDALSLSELDLTELPPRYTTSSSFSGSSRRAFGSQFSRKGSSGNEKTTHAPDPLGLTLIYESEKPFADLIFVHGLGGSSLKTWSYNRDIENLWLPWLGSEMGLSNIRLFTFGYSARLSQDTPTLSILDFAKDLLFQTKMYYDTSREDSKLIGDRPLIFVVHSMGGLVVKKAYIIGKTDEQYASMMSQTYGMIFLGTPHRGSNLTSILNNILRASPMSSTKVFINELEKGSTSLDDINEQFRNVCGDLALVSFHETLKTSLAPGVKAMVVDKESAVLGYPTETSAPLLADHHGLAKFLNREDGNYRDVRNVLRRLVHRIKDLKKLDKPQFANPFPTATLDHILGVKDVTVNLTTFLQRVQPGTCRWILRKKEFLNWIDRSVSGLTILWLTGLPATGKTTLSSFLIDYIRQGDIPGSCQFHFFQADQHETRSISFFLRSIAMQIAQQHEVFHDMLLDMHQETGILFGSQKYNTVWERVFEGLLFMVRLDEPLFWVIDGLDEAENPTALVALISKAMAVTPIKVLFVSRQTRDLSAAFKLDHCLVRHQEIQSTDTSEDIETFVSTIVRHALPDSYEREIVINNILSKAAGSFLWVKLALDRIKDSWHTKDDIQRALAEIPQGMERMYEGMIEAIAQQSPHLQRMASEILIWASCAFRPLSVDELATALRPEFGTFLDLATTIAQICGNFVIIVDSKVTLIHHTARQFLLARDPLRSISVDSRMGHERIATVCMSFLSDTKWRPMFTAMHDTNNGDFSTPASADIFEEIPFLFYAICHWAFHVSSAAADSEDIQTAIFDFLERFGLVWVNAVALTGELRVMTQSAQYLKAFAKRVSHHRSQLAPTSFKYKSSLDADLYQWANDFIRVVGRFGSHLLDSPSSIYKHVVPFCPAESMINRTFKRRGGGSMSVIGISSGNWDDCLARLTMGGDEIASKVICKDGYFVTLIGSSGTLVVWHAETCAEARRLHHGEWVTVIKASKIKGLVASAGIRTIRVWEIATGKETHRLSKSSQGRLMALAFASNDTRLLLAYDDYTIHSVDLLTGQEDWCFHAQDSSTGETYSCPRLMVFSPDAKGIAIAQRGRPVFVWRITRYRQSPQRCVRRDDIYKQDDDVWNSAEVLVWQPDSSNVLILYQDTKLVEWNLDDDMQTEHSHIGAREMVVSDDGNLLLTSDNHGTLSVWSTGQFRLIYQVKYDEFVRDLAFAPDAQRFYDVRGALCNVWEPDALVRSDDTAREDLSTQDTLYSDPVVSSDDNSRVQISAVVCAEGAQVYCTGKEDGSIALYELQTAQKVRRLYGHSNSVSVIDIAWSRSQKYIASVDDSGRVMAKRLEKPTPHGRPKWAVYPLLDLRLGINVTQLLFSQSEEFLLISSATLDRVWSTRTKQKLFQVQRPDNAHRRWIQHPEDPMLLLRIENKELYVCNWITLEEVERSSDQPNALGLRLSSNTDASSDETLSGGVNNLTIQDNTSKFDHQDCGSSSIKSPETLENVYQFKRRFLLLEYFANRCSGHSSSGTYSAATRRLEVIDMQSQQILGSYGIRVLYQLSENVNQVVGVFQGRLVFLDYQYWICTWELDGDEKSYRRHFFLPKDWLSPDSIRLISVDQFGTILCPKNGEMAIVRSGIRL